ncbi:fasciclin domain-containing protein [Dyella subtropica]|uniref:fasciclin domain-containing protein n=1 Tax=Dyella subtropica TaxID=2992127 RepID=UPI0022592C26|nr:fasciclin domain-containing protein [Dyella subtropica]
MYSPVTRVPATNLVDTAAAHGSFTTLRKALDAAELTHVLQGTGPYTVFAPTDEAFGKLPHGTLENWLKPQNKAELVSVLKYHVLRGYASAADIGTMTHPQMLQGQSADIEKDGERISIDGAHLVGADISSSNGVIHAIDAVIQPTKPAANTQ